MTEDRVGEVPGLSAGKEALRGCARDAMVRSLKKGGKGENPNFFEGFQGHGFASK